MALPPAPGLANVSWLTFLDHCEDKEAEQPAIAVPAATQMSTNTHAWCVLQQESSSIACASLEEALHKARQLLAMLPSSNHAPAPKVALTAEHQHPLC